MAPDELQRLAAHITTQHQKTAKLAALIHLCQSALQRPQVEHRADLTGLTEVGRECIAAYTKANGLDPHDVRAALQALRQAGQTARYLSTLPD